MVRSGILEAVRRVIASQGTSRLTLEAVAAEAGISKGGLLYHFPSKESLLLGLLMDEHMSMAQDGWDFFRNDSLPDRPGRIHRAWIRMSAKRDCTVLARHKNMDFGDIAAIVANKQLSEPMKRFWDMMERIMLEDGIEPQTSLVIRLAMAGQKMHRTMSGEQMPQNLADGFFDRLLEMATPSEGTKDYSKQQAWGDCALDAWKGL